MVFITNDGLPKINRKRLCKIVQVSTRDDNGLSLGLEEPCPILTPVSYNSPHPYPRLYLTFLQVSMEAPFFSPLLNHFLRDKLFVVEYGAS